MKRFIGILGMAGIAVLVLMSAAFGTHMGGLAASMPAAAARVETLRQNISHEGMQDSCVPASPFDHTNHLPAAC
jgi:hypothetical protein